MHKCRSSLVSVAIAISDRLSRSSMGPFMLLPFHRGHGHGDYTLVEMPNPRRRFWTSVRAFVIQTAEDVLSAASGKQRGRKGKQVPLHVDGPFLLKEDCQRTLASWPNGVTRNSKLFHTTSLAAPRPITVASFLGYWYKSRTNILPFLSCFYFPKRTRRGQGGSLV